MDLNEVINSAAVKIQSCWRGHWVRKQLKGVYDWYADIVHTIDQIDFLNQKQHNHKNSKYFILKRPSSHTNTFCSRQSPVLNPAEPVSEYEEDTFTSLTSSKQSESSQSLDQNNIENMSKQDLLESKKNLAMELLWIQQAIESRKQYLKIRDKLD